MKIREKKIDALNGIITAHDRVHGTRSPKTTEHKMIQFILKMNNLNRLSIDEHNELLTAFEDYRLKLLTALASSPRVRVNFDEPVKHYHLSLNINIDEIDTSVFDTDLD